MKPIALTHLIMLIAGCIGCHPAVTTQFHGTPLARQQLEKLAGWWKNADGELCRLSPMKDNGCIVCWLDREEDKIGFAAVNMECTFTRLGNKEFVFGRILNVEPKSAEYGFAYVMQREDDILVIAYPNDDVFLEMVESGNIAGKVQTAEKKCRWPLITADSKEFLESVEKIGFEKCFQTDKPQRFTRILGTRE